MPARKPLAPWIVVSLFLVSIAAMPLSSRLLRRPVVVPHTLAGLTERLAQAAPELYVFPSPNGIEDGVWVCTRPHSRKQFQGLMRFSEAKYAQRWQGIVYCEKMAEWNDTAEDQLQDWGEYGIHIGPLLFFGDPDVLQHIHHAILDQQGDKD